MAITWKILVVGVISMLLSACASTENSTANQRVETPPSLQYLSNDNIGRFLVQGRTQVQDIQRWWGRPQAQGESGEIKWYNYTWVGAASDSQSARQSTTQSNAQNTNQRNAGDTKMVTLTVYFMVDTGLLADYDLQVRQFPAYSQ